MRDLIAGGQMSSLESCLLFIFWRERKGRKQGRFPPPTLGLAVPAAPPPNFLLPLEELRWLLGSHGLRSTIASCRAVQAGELLADIYSGRLGVAFRHLFSSLSSLWNTHCLFFFITESPPSAFALFTYLLCFQQLVEKVHSGTALSPWACFSFTFDCPVLQSLWPLLWKKKLTGQGLLRPLLQHAWVDWRLAVSPGLLCCRGLTVSPWQWSTHPAFLTELGVPAGEGGPWCCWGQ